MTNDVTFPRSFPISVPFTCNIQNYEAYMGSKGRLAYLSKANLQTYFQGVGGESALRGLLYKLFEKQLQSTFKSLETGENPRLAGYI